ncbi:MAG: hydroxyacid dehydrogenase [Rhodospirillales bacterium]|nr:hydroxyacid dehydrogenase [Rhodospirillales bacterium]
MKNVLILGKIHSGGVDLLRDATGIAITELPDHSPDMKDHLGKTDAIIVRMTKIGTEEIAAAPGLKIVARHGVGYDTVDVEALTAAGIPLTIVGNVNAVAVAEHTLALMLALSKRLLRYDAATRAGNFDIRNTFSLSELYEKTVLVVGFGRIGQETARRCAAFGMKVIVADPFVAEADVAALEYGHTGDFRKALGKADYVTLHVPKSPETDNMIGAKEMAAMKQGACLINASRGGMVDEQALYDQLSSGHLGGAGLDVFEPEPPTAGHPLFALDTVIISPHCAAFTEECARRMAVSCAESVLAVLSGTLKADLVVNSSVMTNNQTA